MLDRLDIVNLEYVPRSANKMVDTLSSVASTFALEAEEGLYQHVAIKLLCLMIKIQRKTST